MSPNTFTKTIHVEKVVTPAYPKPEDPPSKYWGGFTTPLIWSNIISITLVHILCIWGYVTFPYADHKATFLWSVLLGWCAGFGVTGGAHRLWTHKSYKAKLPLRIVLIVCYAMAGQNRMKEWVRDHRVHHKYSETDADPHNANRGFFFAHVGWLMMRKHPQVLAKGRLVDCSDLFEDPVIVFFEKHFWTMKLFFCFILPIIVPYFVWNETFYWAFLSSNARYVTSLNMTWLVNSAAHMFGNKPYNKNITPVENKMVAIATMGEGWHNYHHTFPWDYKAAELGHFTINATTFLLDFFAKIGWAYDMKSPSPQLIRQTIVNHGDGSHSS